MSSIINVQNIHKSFITPHGDSIDILKDLSFSLNRCESLAILGSSGSGKSTLLSLITGLDAPDKGSIILNGQDIVLLDEKQLSLFRTQNIGIIFQHFYLVSHLTALENVMLPLQFLKVDQAKKKAEQLLDAVGLLPRENHLPRQLSGGEMQRVAIARSLALQPALLVADEPTGNLDVTTAKMVEDLFFHLIKEKQMSAIIVTHSQSLASRCQRTLTLQGGRLS